MEQEIRRPDYVPRVRDRSSSNFNCFLAALGVTLVMGGLVGAAAATSAVKDLTPSSPGLGRKIAAM